ncbi:uncharacterized protein J3D65DRAFT_616803 [Phyllosticta citribraziliensis]|uniref:F-box domain-containing protein n=1 Tax=Phyllosticta citribraziliensis TaxID=989973 RepID=A0ABR1M086_9PEZI
MFAADIATRAQALGLKVHGVSEVEIQTETGISPSSLRILEKRAIERGYDPQVSQKIERQHVTFTTSPDELPVELHLHIISFLDLKGLIKMRSVSKHWRSLIEKYAQNSEVVLPSRYALLQLYDDWTRTFACAETRNLILPHLRNFDRDEYMSNFPGNVPEEFELWIREWPSSAVMGWLWPGLPDRDHDSLPGPDYRFSLEHDNELNRLSTDCLRRWRDPYRNWIYCRINFNADSPHAVDIKTHGAAHGWRVSGKTTNSSLISLETRAIEIQTGCQASDESGGPTRGLVLLIISGAGPFNGTVQGACGDPEEHYVGEVEESWIPEVNCQRPENDYSKSWIEWLRKHMMLLEEIWGGWPTSWGVPHTGSSR